MKRSAEPWRLLALAVALPIAAAASLYAELHAAPPPPAEGVLYARLLVSRTEEPTLGPDTWLSLAAELPGPFTRTAAYCRRHRGHALPNCRNVLTAARASAHLPDRAAARSSATTAATAPPAARREPDAL